MRYYILLLLIISNSVCHTLSGQPDSVTQTVKYHSTKAGNAWIVWCLDNWKTIPDSILWPESTFIKDGYPCSPMKEVNDTFNFTLTLPVKSNLNFMIWVPVNSKGDSTDGWDTYGELMYGSLFDSNRTIRLNDNHLYLPESKSEFKLIKSGWIFLLTSLAISLLLLIFNRKYLVYKSRAMFNGLLIIAVLLSVLTRLEINGFIPHFPLKIFGAISYDLLFYFSLTIAYYFIRRLVRKYPSIVSLTNIFFISAITVSILLTILNIEFVKHLGRPLNYQWIYYSDFMNGIDAKNALKYKSGEKQFLHISLLMSGALLFAFFFSFLPLLSKIYTKGIFIIAFCFVAISVIQLKTISYSDAKIANPAYELAASFISSGKHPKLFSMKIPDHVQKYIRDYHSPKPSGEIKNNHIKHVILFVLESTPSKYIGLYNAEYDVTPNLNKWKNISLVFKKMYAHIPSTSNSMVTMLSGIYPVISYKSIIDDDFNYKLPSIVTTLKNREWETSFFSSADLSFGSMDSYAKVYGFNLVNDSRTIDCNFPSFHITSTMLDGLDDKCLAHRYFSWMDSLKNRNTFCMLWTNQTHYPYFINSENENKYADHPELNRYLNGLHSSDEAFGLLMDGLKERNILDSTLVIVTGDHGEAFETHDQWGHGSKIYEENVHVPFALFNPVLFNGTESDDVGGLIDVAPTLAQILNIPLPENTEGKTLLTERQDSRTFFICPYTEFLFGTRIGNWKYIFNASQNSAELYDLSTDPGELNNLAKVFPEKVKSEHEIIAGWVRYHNDKLKLFESSEK